MIVAGFGFTTSATQHSLVQALEAAGFDGPVDRLATAADKAVCPAFRAFASAQGVPVVRVAAPDLEAADPQTRSPASIRTRRTGSVAEAAALAAAGPGAALIRSRQISNDRMATCAIAEGPNP